MLAVGKHRCVGCDEAHHNDIFRLVSFRGPDGTFAADPTHDLSGRLAWTVAYLVGVGFLHRRRLARDVARCSLPHQESRLQRL
jgi:predicted RNA-binding protein YlxR (DUF448 family)